MCAYGAVCTRGQKTREGAASAVRTRHDHRHGGQLPETQELFDADKRPGEKCGLGTRFRQATRLEVAPQFHHGFGDALGEPGARLRGHEQLQAVAVEVPEVRTVVQIAVDGCDVLDEAAQVVPVAVSRSPVIEKRVQEPGVEIDLVARTTEYGEDVEPRSSVPCCLMLRVETADPGEEEVVRVIRRRV